MSQLKHTLKSSAIPRSKVFYTMMQRMEGTFGERLRALRDAKGLKQGQLAHLAGVTESAIRQMESGQTKKASFDVGLRLADALGVSPWFLATGDEHEGTAEAVHLSELQQLKADLAETVTRQATFQGLVLELLDVLIHTSGSGDRESLAKLLASLRKSA